MSLQRLDHDNGKHIIFIMITIYTHNNNLLLLLLLLRIITDRASACKRFYEGLHRPESQVVPLRAVQ